MGLFDSSGTTTTSTNSNVNFLQPYWQSWLQNLSNITPQSMPVYQGPTVAPLNQNQNTAIDMSQQLATNGTPTYNAATSAIQQQAGGVANPYMGNGPEFQNLVNGVNQNMTDAYRTGTAAQTDAAMARQGAYGGSGYNQLTAQNNKALASAIGNTDAGLAYQNYQNSGNLFNQDQNRQLQASQLGLASQGTDLNAINNLAGMGGLQQGQTQNVQDAMQNYFNQNVQAPFASSSILGNGLSQAGGAPASTSTTTGAGQGSTLANLLGLFGLGYGIFGG